MHGGGQEIKSVLGAHLGATMVESRDPMWQPDPELEQMTVDFRHGSGTAGAGVHAGPLVPPRPRRRAAVQGVRRRDRADRVCARKDFRRGHDAADRLLRGAGRRPDRAARQSRHRHGPAAGDGDDVPLPHLAIPVAPGGGLEGEGLHRDARRLRRAQRALEILGRRRPRRLQELGGGDRPAQPARRPPGRRRAHHAARAVAPRRHDGDPGEPARRAGAAAHALAARPDRRRLPARHRQQSCAGVAVTARTPA